ncbi:rRNA biogenesis protein rrp36 [Recurvomyces mirabilis]|uniref:rRNA biogenesis protein RRP36 n=1 Tax=Recurvomyces mirabilis TaxID=574656 RepID=A0AAE0TP02_9PEZI|nr:rRNA biogenesis protein rrp36 [Recurvomyces mirabilis]KAK5150426.1 rRNA biogenesis protein rrp36 [Recurvomyces mirabilis]
MAPARLLERNVRVRSRVEDEDDDDVENELPEDNLDEDDDDLGSGSEQGEGAAGDGSDLEGEDDSVNGVDVQQQISNVSFGVLRKAQETLSQKRKRGSDEIPEHDDKLEALRKRLRQIKEQKSKVSSEKQQRPARQHDDADASDDEDSDSDSAPSEDGAATKSRSSKHAPAEQTSRHQVTRKRNVIEVPKRAIRDPRFDAFNNHSLHPGNSEKAYGFLDDYQKDEIAELRTAMKKSQSEDDKVALRRKINSMENKLKAKATREREQDVVRAHRKEEREKVEQGKTPYHLKKKEIKERALVEKFKGMKGKEREKVMDKRRLKESQKEKKRMPGARRVAG